MKSDADIVILGAGCAGLSLAAALKARGVGKRVVLVEPRTHYVRDRTWCFWDTEPHPFTEVISHRWKRWRVSSESRAIVQESTKYDYCHIDAGDFYRYGQALVEACPGQELLLGVRATRVEPGGAGLSTVHTDQGEISAGMVFDSRPRLETLAAPALIQRFTGWHLRSARPAFDQSTVGLMQFQPFDGSGRVRFMYVLPFSSTDGLVEMTYLDQPQAAPADASRELSEWCDQYVGQYEILYREQGALPMGGPIPHVEHRGVHALGIRGGRLKPSSGYAFVRIQRHSALIARAIAAGAPLPCAPEPAFFHSLDRLFLRAIAHSPHFAPHLFLTLFKRTNPDVLVEFLSERSSLPAAIGVALKLPRLTMLRALTHRAIPSRIAERSGARSL